jgi:hypothetical protein
MAPSSHHNQVGTPSDSAAVGCTDAEVVGDGVAVGSSWVGEMVSVRIDVSVRVDVSVTVGSGVSWVGDGAATGTDDRVELGSGAG